MSGETVLVTQPTVLTIGHSTRALEPFLEMLRAHGVKHLADVRTIPRSRHNPQFNRDTLPEALRLTRPANVVFTVEYSVRAAQVTVYELLGIGCKIPPVTPHAKSLQAQPAKCRSSFSAFQDATRDQHMEVARYIAEIVILA